MAWRTLLGNTPVLINQHLFGVQTRHGTHGVGGEDDRGRGRHGDQANSLYALMLSLSQNNPPGCKALVTNDR